MVPRYIYCCLLIYVIFVTNSVILCYQKQLLKTQSVTVDTGAVVYSGAVEVGSAISAVECMGKCNSNDECLAFFYSTNSQECIMHPTYNKYIKASATDTGWRYYLTKNVVGRCHQDYLFYRKLDFCYDTLWIDTISFTAIKAGCVSLGGKLTAITSQEKQDYFELIIANRFDLRVCIDGSKQPDGSWITDDGSNLTYFNWNPGQPNDSNEKCLLIYIDDKMGDVLCAFANSCYYVCEF